MGAPPELRFGVRVDDIPLCGFMVRGRGMVFRACVFGGVARDTAGPGVGAAVAGPGLGAAVPGTGAAVPPAIFVDSACPDVEFCLFGAAVFGLDPAGQGVAVWLAARVAEIRNNHIMFAINFM